MQEFITDHALSELASEGITVCDWSARAQLWQPLYHRLLSLEASSQLHDARIGGDSKSTRNESIRADSTLWLNPEDKIDAIWLDTLETVRTTLNQQLFLGLKEVEAHYASYPEGGHYDWHWDNPPHSLRRRISTVLYLNNDWHPQFGGEFEYLDSSGRAHRLCPIGGHFVLFRSDTIKHRVLPATSRRRSITAWFM